MPFSCNRFRRHPAADFDHLAAVPITAKARISFNLDLVDPTILALDTDGSVRKPRELAFGRSSQTVVVYQRTTSYSFFTSTIPSYLYTCST